jgi:hypothetical protein
VIATLALGAGMRYALTRLGEQVVADIRKGGVPGG